VIVVLVRVTDVLLLIATPAATSMLVVMLSLPAWRISTWLRVLSALFEKKATPFHQPCCSSPGVAVMVIGSLDVPSAINADPDRTSKATPSAN